MDKFWQLLGESVIIQGFLAVATTLAVIFLVCVGKPIPQELSGGWLLILGFFFGSKGEVGVRKALQSVVQPSSGSSGAPADEG